MWGTIDSRQRIVRYSNNIKWENVEIVKELSKFFPIPICIANNADVLKEIVDLYIRRLGIGIVNFVNIFRPQLVLLGGGLSAQGKTLTVPIYEMMKDGCFGKEKSELPELAIAALGNRAGMIGAASLI